MKDDKNKNQFDKRRKDNKMLSKKSENGWKKTLIEDNKKRKNRRSRFQHMNC
jgi:hypothetical protein